MSEVTVTQYDIEHGLRDLGLREGDCVLMHSSLSSFGYVEGGADAVIDALLGVIGDTGTAMVPNIPVTWRSGETHEDYLAREPVFDVRTTPSGVGKITEVFRRRPDARRSLSACHSVAAIGARRDWILAGHEDCSGSTGPGTPYWKNCQIGGKVLLIGVTQSRNTTIHTIEETAAPEVFLTREAFRSKVIDRAGETHTLNTRAHTPGIPRHFERIEPLLAGEGALTTETIGRSTLRLVDAGALFRIGVELLEEDPLFLTKLDELPPG